MLKKLAPSGTRERQYPRLNMQTAVARQMLVRYDRRANSNPFRDPLEIPQNRNFSAS
jgi:hypothetical protein